MLTTAELVNIIHMRSRRMMPMVTEVETLQNAVYYTIGSRRYMANRNLEVLEVEDGKMFDSTHARYQQGLLRGRKRDDAGNLIGENLFGDSGSTIRKDK